MDQKNDMPEKEPKLKHKITRKFVLAFQGIAEAIRIDNSFKYHFAAAVLAVIAGFILRISEAEWIAIVIVIAMVLVSEMFNTVCEIMMRLYTDKYDRRVKVLLDISAGAVLFASIAALVVGIIVFSNNVDTLKSYFQAR